jgi:hypothetical protein
MNVREKIKSRLDDLESDLRAGKHLSGDKSRAEIEVLLFSISKFVGVLKDSDRDFIMVARHAISHEIPWK